MGPVDGGDDDEANLDGDGGDSDDVLADDLIDDLGEGLATVADETAAASFVFSDCAAASWDCAAARAASAATLASRSVVDVTSAAARALLSRLAAVAAASAVRRDAVSASRRESTSSLSVLTSLETVAAYLQDSGLGR